MADPSDLPLLEFDPDRDAVIEPGALGAPDEVGDAAPPGALPHGAPGPTRPGGVEAAALIAVARFRGVRLAQVIYAGDSLASEVYDHHGWDKHLSVRENLFWIAADAAAAWPPE